MKNSPTVSQGMIGREKHLAVAFLAGSIDLLESFADFLFTGRKVDIPGGTE
jgi:hypothetical protein